MTRLCLACGQRRPLDEFSKTGGHFLLICETCNDVPLRADRIAYINDEFRRMARLASHKKYNQRRRREGAAW